MHTWIFEGGYAKHIKQMHKGEITTHMVVPSTPFDLLYLAEWVTIDQGGLQLQVLTLYTTSVGGLYTSHRLRTVKTLT